MELDARATTHPIQQPVTRDSEAESAFDTITYDKGSGFLRMLEAWLGEAAFRDGIRAYLKRHHYANTTSADLWEALAAASGKPVAAIAADWTTQPGFPLLDVDAQCDGGRRRVVVRQQPFRVPDDARRGRRDARRWNVPVQLGSVGAGAGDPCSCAKRAPPSSATTMRRAAGRRRRQRRLLPRPLCRAAVRRAGGALARPARRRAPEAARRHLGARPRRPGAARALARPGRADRRRAAPGGLGPAARRPRALRPAERRRAGASGPASLRDRRARAALRAARLGRARRRARRGAPAARPAGGDALALRRRGDDRRRAAPLRALGRRADEPGALARLRGRRDRRPPRRRRHLRDPARPGAARTDQRGALPRLPRDGDGARPGARRAHRAARPRPRRAADHPPRAARLGRALGPSRARLGLRARARRCPARRHEALRRRPAFAAIVSTSASTATADELEAFARRACPATRSSTCAAARTKSGRGRR